MCFFFGSRINFMNALLKFEKDINNLNNSIL